MDGSRDTQVLTLTDENKDMDTNSPNDQDDNSDLTAEEEIENKEHKDYLASLDIGIEAGNLCPVCQEGEVIKRGGCTECSVCSVQLKCD